MREEITNDSLNIQ